MLRENHTAGDVRCVYGQSGGVKYPILIEQLEYINIDWYQSQLTTRRPVANLLNTSGSSHNIFVVIAVKPTAPDAGTDPADSSRKADLPGTSGGAARQWGTKPFQLSDA